MTAWIGALDALAAEWFARMVRACWQGGLAIAVVWLLCRLLKKMPPEGRGWLWRLAYLKLLLALCWATPIVLAVLPPEPMSSELGLVVVRQAAEPSTAPAAIPDVGADTQISATTSPTELTAAPAIEFSTAPAAASLSGARIALLMIWLVGAGLVAAGSARRWVLAHRLRRSSRPLIDARLADWLSESCGRLGLHRRPALAVSDIVSGPMLLGVARPVILLPKTLLEDISDAEVRVALLHELAHVKRRDLLWNWLPVLGDFFFYWHPAVWLARRQWRLEQETACDRMAISAPGSSAADLATLLLKVVTRRPSGVSTAVAAAGLSESRSQIEKRLLAMKCFDPSHPKRKAAAAILVLLVAILGVIPWRLTAAEPGGLVDSVLSKLAARGETEVKASILVLPPESGATANGAVDKKQPRQHELLPTYAALVSSRVVIDRAAEQLATHEGFDLDGQPREQWADVLKKNLRAKVLPHTNIIEISYRGEDPQVAVTVVDAVLGVYVAFLGESHKDSTAEILQLLTKEHGELLEKIGRKHEELLEARREAETIRLSSENGDVNLVVRRAIKLNEAWIEAMQRRLEAESQLVAIKAAAGDRDALGEQVLELFDMPSEAALRAAFGFSHEDAYACAQLSRHLLDDKATLRSLLATHGPQHPKVREVQLRIDVTEQFLTNRANAPSERGSETKDSFHEFLLAFTRKQADLARKHESRVRQSYEEAKTEALEWAHQTNHLALVEYDLQRLRAFQDTLIEQIKGLDCQQDRRQIRVAIVQGPTATGPKAPPANAEPGPAAVEVPSPKDERRIRPRDAFEVTFLTPDGFSEVSVRVRVGEDGTARVPLVGKISVAGLTPEALRQKIATAAVQHGITADPGDSVIHRLEYRHD